MRTDNFILDKDDCRDKASGYHLDIWGDICDSFGLNPEKTIRIRINLIEVLDEAEEKPLETIDTHLHTKAESG